MQMREILFRGKRADNGKWINGYFARFGIIPVIGACDKRGAMHWYEVEPESVGQYTGLKSKTGEKVFEHDVLVVNYGDEFVDHKGIIEFHSGHFALRKPGGKIALLGGFYLHCEVIGNLHDNPELLEGGADG